jgi:hypothetical protein
MNLPTSLCSRLAALAVLAGAVLCASASTASAAANWQPGQNVLLKTNINYAIDDDEYWYKNRTSINAKADLGKLGYNIKGWTKKISRCGDDEVRAELEFQASTSWTQMVTVKVRLNLYEGASCETQDLDGQTMWHTYVLEPGESVQDDIEVSNSAEGGDYAWTGFDIYAQKAW